MKFRVIIEHDPETNSYSAVCPELPGCCSAGITEEETLANVKEAIELYLEPSEITTECKGKICEIEVTLD